MTSRMIGRIDAGVRGRFSKPGKGEENTASQMARDLIKNCIEKRDINATVDDLWSRIGRKLRSRGVKQKDIGKAIKETRKSRT